MKYCLLTLDLYGFTYISLSNSVYAQHREMSPQLLVAIEHAELVLPDAQRQYISRRTSPHSRMTYVCTGQLCPDHSYVSCVYKKHDTT